MLNQHGILCKKLSKIYLTAPWGFQSPNYFYNAVMLGETVLSPWELILTLKKIEMIMGRKLNDFSYKKYRDRIIDIDIIFYENIIIKNNFLKIPHPLMLERAFVMIPSLEIIPNWVHPEVNKTVKQLVEENKEIYSYQYIKPILEAGETPDEVKT